MKNIKKLVLSSLVGLMALSSMGVGSVAAEGGTSIPPKTTEATVNFQEKQNGLEFVSASSKIDFETIDFTYGRIEKQGAKVDENEETNFQIVVNDDRTGNIQKWDLKAAVSSGETQGLPKGSLITFNNGNVDSNYELTGVNPNVEATLPLRVGDQGVSVLNADRNKLDNQGIGAWILEYPAKDIQLTMEPEHMALISAAAGTYSTTITWTLSDGPQ